MSDKSVVTLRRELQWKDSAFERSLTDPRER